MIIIWHKDGYVFVKRKNEPYKGSWALPGGIVEYGETALLAKTRK